MLNKKRTVDILRIFLYVSIVLLFFFTWALRKEFIVGFAPAVIHFALFWGLFVLVRKKVRTNADEIKGGVTKGEKTTIKVVLIFAGLGLLFLILAPLFT